MKSIVLLGYMGAGKTTIGHALAKVLGVTFYDLDWYIEMRFHKTVAQILLSAARRVFARLSVICCMRWLSLRMWSSRVVGDALLF